MVHITRSTAIIMILLAQAVTVFAAPIGGTNNLDKAEREAANAEAIDKAHADIKAAEGQLKIFQPQFSEMTKGDSRKTFYEKQIKPYEEQIKSARQRLSELGYRTPAEQDAAMRAQMANHSGSG